MAGPRHVLVTGGAGFIGSHVCDAFLREGWRVTALDDLSSGRRERVPSGADLVELDIRSDRVEELFDERDFDLVNHHAAQIDVRESVSDPVFDASINVQGLLNLLENARRTGVERFVYISSGGVVYGEGEELPLPETTPKQPLSPYGVGKLAGEHYLFYYRRVHGLPSVSLRYSNVYGPRQDPHGEAGVVAIFSGRLKRGEPLTVFGDGRQTRDYVYVKDVAEANLLVSSMDLPEAGTMDDTAFNVSTGRQTSVLDLARMLMEVSGRDVDLEHAPERPGELRRNALDASRLRSSGWTNRHTLREGLEETYAALAGADL